METIHPLVAVAVLGLSTVVCLAQYYGLLPFLSEEEDV